MQRNGAIEFTSAAKQRPECKLDLDRVPVALGEPGKRLDGTVEAIVQKMVEATVVITRQWR